MSTRPIIGTRLKQTPNGEPVGTIFVQRDRLAESGRRCAVKSGLAVENIYFETFVPAAA
jgi:hypothetical protein